MQDKETTNNRSHQCLPPMHMTQKRPRSIITGDELSPQDYMLIAENAVKLRRLYDEERKSPPVLRGRRMIQLFEHPSTRTWIAGDVSNAYGGHTTLIKAEDVFKRGDGKIREDLEDWTRTTEGTYDLIGARVKSDDTLEELKKQAKSAGVFNLLSPKYHPQQALAQLSVLLEKFGPDGIRKITWAWVGDFTNVAYSVVMMLTKVGVRKTAVASPQQYSARPEQRQRLDALARESGTELVWTTEPEEAVRGADYIGTDTFTSMGQETDERKKRDVFVPKYQVTRALLELAKGPKTGVHHCLPAHWGDELERAVRDDGHPEIYREAHLRVQALVASMMWALDISMEEVIDRSMPG